MLLKFDVYIARGNFAVLYSAVRYYPIAAKSPTEGMVTHICRAVDIACMAYWKNVMCFQRSAATVCLLRGSGVGAKMVLGAQQVPFKSHAWVEVDTRIVNDKPYIAELYPILDKC